MNGLQIATWIILAATIILNSYSIWTLWKTAQIRKQTKAKQRKSALMHSGWEK